MLSDLVKHYLSVEDNRYLIQRKAVGIECDDGSTEQAIIYLIDSKSKDFKQGLLIESESDSSEGMLKSIKEGIAAF